MVLLLFPFDQVHFQLPMLLVVLVILGFKPYVFNVHSLRLLNSFPFFSKDCKLFLWQIKLAELYALVNCQWYFSGGLRNLFPSFCVGVFDFMNHSCPETTTCNLFFLLLLFLFSVHLHFQIPMLLVILIILGFKLYQSQLLFTVLCVHLNIPQVIAWFSL